MAVFSNSRVLVAPAIKLPARLKLNKKIQMDGLKFMSKIPTSSVPAVFFDPQYRGVYEKLKYGNEKTSRNYHRVLIPQMSDDMIREFINKINDILMPSGHLFLWLDKFHLCTNYGDWFSDCDLNKVDLITWNKKKIGLGYRTRHTSEFMLILQKNPKRAKGVWCLRDIPDVWDEKIRLNGKNYHHSKPLGLQQKLIECTTNVGDVVVDPAAGSFSVLESCKNTDREFLGCDIKV